MSETSAVTVTETPVLSGSFVSNLDDLPKLSSGSRRKSSAFAKIYKEASNLFLTCQFDEALQCLEQLISRPKYQRGGQDVIIDAISPDSCLGTAERKWRIKIWSLYLSLVNAILDLGRDEGGKAIGLENWEMFEKQVQDGSIWDEVIQVGYNGHEDRLDSEIVINLANLMLAQSENQRANQARLENHFSTNNSRSRTESQASDGSDGTNTSYEKDNLMAKELDTQTQLLELYTLHVLPANNEWEYAKTFIEISQILDDQKRFQLLATLDELQQQELPNGADRSLTHSSPSPLEREPVSIKRTNSNITVIPAKMRDPVQNSAGTIIDNPIGLDVGVLDSPSPAEPSVMRTLSPKPILTINQDTDDAASTSTFNPSSISAARSRAQAQNTRSCPSLWDQGVAAITTVQKIVQNLSINLSRDPTPLLRTILFILGLMVTLSRGKLRARVLEFVNQCWLKIRRTLAMGMKMSHV